MSRSRSTYGRRLLPLAAILLTMARPQSAGAVPDALPDQEWRTLEAPPFVYHYTEAGRPFVEALMPLGPRIFAQLRAWIGSEPVTPVHVVVIPEQDVTNGLTTPLPRNTIRIYPKPPQPPSTLAEYRNWLELIFTHELLHVFHLDAALGPAQWLRSLFGRELMVLVGLLPGPTVALPIAPLFPNALLPDTLLEGYAVWAETALTGVGRANGAAAGTLIRNYALDGNLPELGDALGLRRAPPAGETPYLFGGRFHRFLAEDDPGAWQRFYRVNSVGCFPFCWGIPFALSSGEFPAASWARWRSGERRAARLLHRLHTAAPPVTRLAAPTWRLASLRWTSAGLVARRHDGFHHEALVRWTGSGWQSIVELNGGRGVARSADGTWWFDALELEASAVVASDLWRYHPERGRERLTRGAHLFEPDVRRGRIAVVHWLDARACLDVYPVHLWSGRTMPLGPEDLRPVARWCARPFENLASPRWDPAGRRLLFLRWEATGGWRLYLWDPERGGPPEALTSRSGTLWWPQWDADGRGVWLVRTLDGTPQLYHRALTTAGWVRLGPLPQGIWTYAVAEGHLYWTTPEPGGWPLYTVRLTSLARTPAAAVLPRDPRVVTHLRGTPTTRTTLPPDRAYDPWETLAPTGWSPLLGGTDGRWWGGIAVGGNDVLESWQWTANLFGVSGFGLFGDATLARVAGPRLWRVTGGRFPVDVSTAEDRWRLEGLLQWRWLELDRGRSLASLLGIEGGRELRPRWNLVLLGAWDTRRSYAWWLQEGEGATWRGAVGLDLPAGPLGCTGSDCTSAWNVDARLELTHHGGIPLWRRLALTWGLDLGGHLQPGGPLAYRLEPPGGIAFGPRTRMGAGVPAGGLADVDRYALGELDLMLPLVWAQRGAGSIPLYLDDVHLRPYVAGAAWERAMEREALAYGGVELGIDLVALWRVGLPIRLGVRLPLGRPGEPEPYFRMGFYRERWGAGLRPPGPRLGPGWPRPAPAMER